MQKGKTSGIGTRIASARKAAGLSQQQVAGSLGIPQRTLSYYEKDGDLPSSLIVPLADILGVGVHELLGIDESGPRKRGPKGSLQERFDAVRKLPRKDQEFVIKFLDQVIEDYSRRRRKGGNGSQN